MIDDKIRLTAAHANVDLSAGLPAAGRGNGMNGPVPTGPTRSTQESGPRTAATSSVLYEKQQHVAWVTINRRDALNAIDLATAERLTHIWRQVGADEGVHTVVLIGAGPEAFSIGFDRRTPARLIGPKACGLHKRLVVAVNGTVCREGFQFLRDADLVVCADNATFFEPRWGDTADPGPGAERERVRGMRSAATRRDPVTASEAYSLGLVQEVVSLRRLRSATEQVVERMLTPPG
ncbi:enoyl-CoA hydratase/isomerase family protein [Streptomyces sp. NPDC056405]|uniref:enoyl-CoA hydratase/isomerase family protein n=1 Tax=Streptomyces sp. NPDC056405 TaxID=3345811 RepID=UPI0035D5A70E